MFYWLVFPKKIVSKQILSFCTKYFVLLPTNISTMFRLLLKYCPTIIVEVSLINPTPIPRRKKIFFLISYLMERFPVPRWRSSHRRRENIFIGGLVSGEYYTSEVLYHRRKSKTTCFLAKILIFKRMYQKQHFCQMIKS